MIAVLISYISYIYIHHLSSYYTALILGGISVDICTTDDVREM